MGAATNSELDIGFELFGSGIFHTEVLLDLRRGEGLGNVEDHLILGFLAIEEVGDFGILHVGKRERNENVHATLFFFALFVELDGFAVDIITFAHYFGGFEFTKTLLDVFDLGVHVFGGEFDGTELGIDFAPIDIDLRSESSIEIESKIGVLGKVDGASFLVVGERRTYDFELLILDVFIKRLTQEVLDCIGNDGRSVHALNQTHGGHTLTEARHGGLVLVLFQLLGYLFGIVVFCDLYLNTKVQIS